MLDLLIVDGLLIDPERRTATPGYVGIEHGRIACTGSGSTPPARAVIDAAGHMVCPGFIDVHGHLDGDVRTGMLSLHQGVTTTVGGNCGYSPDDLEVFFARQEALGYPIHQAEFIGHSFSLRRQVGIEDPFAAATPAQIQRMVELARRALAHGACGVSFGLGYAPGTTHEEALALCEQAAAQGRIVAIDTNMRTKSDLFSLVEVLCLARQSKAPMLVSHFVYQYGDHMEEEALALMAHAREHGIDIWADSGMYTHWATSIGCALFEPYLLRDNQIELWHLRMATGEHRGQVLDQALYDHVRAEHPHDTVVVQVDHEEAVFTILRPEYVMPSSDAGPYQPGEGHPQIAGTFPRFFAEMVTHRGDLSWPEAIARATLLPAQTLRMADRGRLRAGCAADLVIFDPHTLRDRADYVGLGLPDALPEGILHVIVDGTHALCNGKVLCGTAGRPLRFE